MTLLPALAAVVAPVFLIAFGGYLWSRTRQPFDHDLVTRLVTWAGAPAMVFSNLANTQQSLDTVARIGVATAGCLLAPGIIGAIGLKLARMPLKVYLPSLIFPNIGNAGLPVCMFAFGQDGMSLAMVFFTVTSVAQFTIGPALAAGSFRPGELLKVPLVHAVLVSLLVLATGVTVPRWLSNTVSLLAGLTIPLMLLSLGVALSEMKAANTGRAIVFSVLRIGLGLASGWGVAVALGLEGAARGVVVIESSMPAAVFNYLFARMHGNSPDEVAGLILVSTLLSVLTLPLILATVM